MPAELLGTDCILLAKIINAFHNTVEFVDNRVHFCIQLFIQLLLYSLADSFQDNIGLIGE
jgi:hypothetical protein